MMSTLSPPTGLVGLFERLWSFFVFSSGDILYNEENYLEKRGKIVENSVVITDKRPQSTLNSSLPYRW